mmetsp:Transcript_12871/g.12710  ORF Transcript_12871/g.12710 Transcript_12871/m.12710 type:complete len:90 (+) Transcript_12871:35-304(+)
MVNAVLVTPSPTLLYLSRDDTRDAMLRTVIMYCWWRQFKGSPNQRYGVISDTLKTALSVGKLGKEFSILYARRLSRSSSKKDIIMDLIH